MIFMYTGTPGSGKSLHCAKEIYWHVKMKRPVICNFDINDEAVKGERNNFRYVPNERLTPNYLVNFAKEWWARNPHSFHEGAITLYIDECQLIFNTREWRYNAPWIDFFTQHRKLGYNVILVCQNKEMVDKQIRSIVEYETLHKKLNNVGWVGKFWNLVFLGRPVTVCVTRWMGMRGKLKSEWIIGGKRAYSLFDSYKLFDSASSVVTAD